MSTLKSKRVLGQLVKSFLLILCVSSGIMHAGVCIDNYLPGGTNDTYVHVVGQGYFWLRQGPNELPFMPSGGYVYWNSSSASLGAMPYVWGSNYVVKVYIPGGSSLALEGPIRVGSFFAGMVRGVTFGSVVACLALIVRVVRSAGANKLDI